MEFRRPKTKGRLRACDRTRGYALEPERGSLEEAGGGKDEERATSAKLRLSFLDKTSTHGWDVAPSEDEMKEFARDITCSFHILKEILKIELVTTPSL